jgi:hypothetical protein
VSTIRLLPEPIPLGPPFVLHWRAADNPLPVRVIRSARSKIHAQLFPVARPWAKVGVEDRSFDFCAAVHRVCVDIVAKCTELAHIDPSRLLFAVTQARNGHAHGLQARVTPLRFPGGRLTRQRRGITYQVQRYVSGDTEFLYLVSFCLPRFLNQDFDNKLITLFHELFHIGPTFDGDLRRHPGRYSVHSHSQRLYDEKMAALAREYLNRKPEIHVLDFLRLDFAQLEQRHGSVSGVVVPRPKIIPILPRRQII